SLQDKNISERFKREARILAQLDHPNIIKVLDFGTFGKYFYISFEYFTGSNLREAVRSKSIGLQEKKSILRQIFQGLEAAHRQQIIHRDLKPENILINDCCEIKIADFGLAQSAEDNMVTNKYGIVGTPGYMSPEQIRGETLSVQSDLFSSGIIAYELFTGENPFLGKDINETINNILRFRESFLEEKLSRLPDDEIKEIIKLLLVKNKTQRAKTAQDILCLLEAEVVKNGVAPKNSFAIPQNDALPLNGSKSESISIEKTKFHLSRKVIDKKYVFIALAFITVLLALIAFMQMKESIKTVKGIHESPAMSLTGQTEAPQKYAAQSENKTDKENNAGNEIKTKDENKTDSEKKQLEKNEEQSKNNDISLKGDNPGDNNPSGDKARRSSIPETKTSHSPSLGKLMVLCQPWADIYIDSVKAETTPLNSHIILKTGMHRLVLKNPGFPPYSQQINIKRNDTLLINISFKNLIGYFRCDISPWGDLYIDGIKVGQTPLKEPVPLMPGRHSLIMKNPNYADKHDEIVIHKGETYHYKYSFTDNLDGQGAVKQ
ncbi:MAG: serine/threonine-protein kinase, partial [Clostridiales bacterium]